MSSLDYMYMDRVMFDGFQMKLPDEMKSTTSIRHYPHEALFQLSGFDCFNDNYMVTDDGQLMVQVGFPVDKNNNPIKPVNFTGDAFIYTDIPVPPKKPNPYILSVPKPERLILVWESVEYKLVFKQGKLVSVEHSW